MSNPVFDLTNAARWSLAYTTHIEAPSAPNNGWYGINPFYAPIILNSHTLLFSVESEWARAHWWLGCKVQQIIDAPGTDFVEIPANSRALPIGRPYLVRFPKLHGQYRLRFEIPYWHKNITIKAWEYTGPESDSTEDLVFSSTQSIEISLDRIESKVDELREP